MKFDELCEAYEVLSNGKLQFCRLFHKFTNELYFIVELKAIYDKFGEYGLKEGVILPNGTKCGGGYFKQKSSNDIFEAEFSSTDPFEF
jgi:DnaJ-class molecular chaperone